MPEQVERHAIRVLYATFFGRLPELQELEHHTAHCHDDENYLANLIKQLRATAAPLDAIPALAEPSVVPLDTTTLSGHAQKFLQQMRIMENMRRSG